MERSTQDHLTNALDDLSKEELKRFKNKLVDRKAEPVVRRRAVDSVEYTTELASLLTNTFTDNPAVLVTLEVLRSIGCNQVAKNLELATGGGCPAPPVLVSPTPPAPVQDDNIRTPQGPARTPVSSGYDLPDTSGMLIPSSLQFKQQIISKTGNDMYDALDKGMRKRLALIINNVEFDIKSHKRNGAERDEENMGRLLRALGYHVIKYKNLSGKEMDKAIKSFAESPEHAESDSTFVVIMSHGMRDKILGIHYGPDHADDFLLVDKIYTHLNTANCPALLNKPKIILIQACRGGKVGGTWVADSDLDEEWDFESDDSWEHAEKDFISLMSCTPDTKAFRDPVNGALFFGFLVQVFNANAHKDHVEELFRQVMRRFEDFRSTQVKQMVCKERATLTKLFYLFPGL